MEFIKRMKNKFLVLGIDGLPPPSHFPYRECLPLISKYFNNKFFALRSEYPLNSVANWYSIFTGMTPLQHRKLDFFWYDFTSQSFKLNDCRDITHMTLWSINESKGGTCLLIDVPFSKEHQLKCSIVAPGLPSIGHSSLKGNSPIPIKNHREFLIAYEKFVRDQNIEVGVQTDHSKVDKKIVLEQCCSTYGAKFDLAKIGVASGTYNLVTLLVTESDRVLHYFASDVLATENGATTDRDSTIAFFNKIDCECNELIKMASLNGFQTVLLSDHGFKRVDKTVHIPNILKEIGLCIYDKKICDALRVDTKNSLVIPSMASLGGLHINRNHDHIRRMHNKDIYKFAENVKSLLLQYSSMELDFCEDILTYFDNKWGERGWYPPELLLKLKGGHRITSKVGVEKTSDSGPLTGSHHEEGVIASDCEDVVQVLECCKLASVVDVLNIIGVKQQNISDMERYL
jgi:predicted AlkP superfamily phosphohydrolase/phosphomutase